MNNNRKTAIILVIFTIIMLLLHKIPVVMKGTFFVGSDLPRGYELVEYGLTSSFLFISIVTVLVVVVRMLTKRN